MLTLYFAPGASSFAVHIALHEIGAAFEARPMSFKNNDLQSPDFLALNPEGKVPTLLIDGRPLTEVAAILFYLAQALSRSRAVATRRYRGRGAGDIMDVVHRIHPASGAPARAGPCAGSVWRSPTGGWASGWALGERYSIADIHLFRLYWRLFNSLKPMPERISEP